MKSEFHAPPPPSTSLRRPTTGRRFIVLLFLAALLHVGGALSETASASTSSSAPSSARASAQKKKKSERQSSRRRRRASSRRARAAARQDVASQKIVAGKPSPRATYEEPAREDEHDGEAEGDPDRRQNWLLQKRIYPLGYVPVNARRAAWEARPPRAKTLSSTLSAAPVWTSVGPAPTTAAFPNNWGVTSGRINAVAVSPADPQIVLIGASTGGVWRSTNGGANFAPVSDTQVDLAVGSIAFARSNPSIVYAGMGDLDNSYLGTGLLRSTDAGQTWARVSNDTLPAQALVTDVEVDPTNPNRVYVTQAASLIGANGALAASGFFVSSDGGVNFQKTLGGNARDVAFHPSNPSIVYLAMRTVDSGGVPGVYRSNNGGVNWSLVYTSPYPGADTRDVRITTTPADPNRVYVLVGTRTPTANIRVEVSFDGGANWANRGATNVDNAQFGYNTYLYASHADPNTIYLGSRDIYKSTDGGVSWSNITKNFHVQPDGTTYSYNPTVSNTHPDQQSFAFSPFDANTVYAGNDGGISRSTNGGANFLSLNATLSLTQFVGISLHPTDPAISYGGAQDNGTQRRLNGTSAWREFSAGDGGRSVINPSNNAMVFTTYIYGRINRFTNNGQSSSGAIANNDTFGEPATGQRIGFYPPFVGNGVDSKLYFGTYRLFVCTDCHDTSKSYSTPVRPNWSAPGGTFDQTRGGADILSAIGVARSNPNVIYTGSAQGRVMVSTNGGASWTDITAGLPNRFVESIRVSDADASVAYLSVSGYGTGHVFRTTNGGATWADLSGNLPNIPTSDVLADPLDPSTIYAGTDIGVFRSTSGGTTWETFNDGLPPVVVTAFAAQANGRIQIATYGRGAYEMTSQQTTPNPTTLSFTDVSVSVNESSGVARFTVTRGGDTSGTSSVDYATANGTASDRSDYTAAIGTLNYAPGETSKTIDVFITDDAYAEPTEALTLALSNLSGAGPGTFLTVTVNITDNEGGSNGANPVKESSFNASFFVRQHYRDFLNREPDASGLAFWVNQANNCGNADVRVCRYNVSAAFFLSGEFQQTGYLAYRFHQVAFNTGERLQVRTFLADSQEIGRGVVVGQPGSENQLETNKQTYANRFVARPEFTSLYGGMTNTQFVDALNANTGGALTQGERDALVNGLNGATLTRAQVLRAVAENAEFDRRQKNRAFVLMQYFGYLRRNPNDQTPPDFSGYDFWLGKLNQFGGNYITSEMVKAFVTSGEYIARFGP